MHSGVHAHVGVCILSFLNLRHLNVKPENYGGTKTSKVVPIVCLKEKVIFKAKINCLNDILKLNISSSFIDTFLKSPKEQGRIQTHK